MAYTIDERSTPEFAGAMMYRFLDIDIINYDDDDSGDGEAFTAEDAGMSRLQQVDVQVIPDGNSEASTEVNAVAQYDYTAGAIRLMYGGTDGSELSEVTSNTDEGARVRVKAIGR